MYLRLGYRTTHQNTSHAFAGRQSAS
jgi:hypothetical protein